MTAFTECCRNAFVAVGRTSEHAVRKSPYSSCIADGQIAPNSTLLPTLRVATQDGSFKRDPKLLGLVASTFLATDSYADEMALPAVTSPWGQQYYAAGRAEADRVALAAPAERNGRIAAANAARDYAQNKRPPRSKKSSTKLGRITTRRSPWLKRSIPGPWTRRTLWMRPSDPRHA